MNQRTTVLILAILLMSYFPSLEYDSETEYDEMNFLDQNYKRTEISLIQILCKVVYH